MLLTLGLIPGATNIRYGDIRDRVRLDGTHWLQPELKAFFNGKCEETNLVPTDKQKLYYRFTNAAGNMASIPKRGAHKLKRVLAKK